MNPSLAIGACGSAFLVALGVFLWLRFGDVIFAAMTEFGVLICG